MPTAEVVSIGSELTSGASLDTNGQWLSRRLSELGISVTHHTTVADDLQANIAVFNAATQRADAILVTGGLGPTADDLTRDALACLAGLELVLDETSLSQIKAMFAKRGRQMTDRNRCQAMFPAGATPIPNPRGTAPGVWMEHNNSVIACMPGVPSEMYGMFDEWVRPRLGERFGSGSVILRHALHSFGAGESAVEEMLGEMTNRGHDPEVGITASEATITVRIAAAADSQTQARQKLHATARQVREKLGDLIFGVDGEELQQCVASLLQQTSTTISTAESCTGGLVGHLLTEVPGISAHYCGGIVAYSNQIKHELLGVDNAILQQHGAVSPECAAAMATGCRDRFGSDLAVSITGIAGPDGGTDEKPVGLVYVALAHQDGIETAKYNWPSNRSSTKLRSAKTALNLIRRHLTEVAGNLKDHK